MKLLPLLTAIATCLGGASMAQDAVLRPVFDRLDGNNDKVLARTEFPGSDAQFAAMDRDKDGRVSFDEYRVSAVARRYLAARNADATAPRPRIDVDETTASTLQLLARFDRNRDGRIDKDEWAGPPTAFDGLDLDRNGVLDAKDRKIAERKIADKKKGTYDELEFNSYLPSPDDLFKRYDKNKDQLLARKEVGGAKLAPLFDIADRNLDSMLDVDEVGLMVREVAMRVRRRNMGYAPPRAFIVPFSTWDKNNDGRLDTGEWLERKYLFPGIDVDRDGAVTKEEVARYKNIVEGEDFVERFDLNGDGKVTISEFAGPRDAFRRADRNNDGAISRADR